MLAVEGDNLEGAEVKEPRVRLRSFVRAEFTTAGVVVVAGPAFVAVAWDGTKISAFLLSSSPKAESVVAFSSRRKAAVQVTPPLEVLELLAHAHQDRPGRDSHRSSCPDG
jgi:hypothetical protein